MSSSRMWLVVVLCVLLAWTPSVLAAGQLQCPNNNLPGSGGGVLVKGDAAIYFDDDGSVVLKRDAVLPCLTISSGLTVDGALIVENNNLMDLLAQQNYTTHQVLDIVCRTLVEIIAQQNSTTNDLNDNSATSHSKLTNIQNTLANHGVDLDTLISQTVANGLDIATAQAVIDAINLKTIDTNNDVGVVQTTVSAIQTTTGTVNTKVNTLQSTANNIEFLASQNLLKLTDTLDLSLDINETLFQVRQERRRTQHNITHLQQRNELLMRQLNNTVVWQFKNRTREVDPYLKEINGTNWDTLQLLRQTTGSNDAVLTSIDTDTTNIIVTQTAHTTALGVIDAYVDTVETTQAAHTTSLGNIYTDTQALLSVQTTHGTQLTAIKGVVDLNKVDTTAALSAIGDNNVLLTGIDTQVNDIWGDTAGLVVSVGAVDAKITTIQGTGVACNNLGTGTAGYRVVYVGATTSSYFGYEGGNFRGFKDVCEVDYAGQGLHPCTHNDILTAGAQMATFSGWVIDGMEMDFFGFHDGASATVPVISYCSRTKGGAFDATFTDGENFACSTSNSPWRTRYPNCGDWVLAPGNSGIASQFRGAFYNGATGHYRLLGCQTAAPLPCCKYDGS